MNRLCGVFFERGGEFVAEALGNAQNAIGGGGRYDKLAEQLGVDRRALDTAVFPDSAGVEPVRGIV